MEMQILNPFLVGCKAHLQLDWGIIFFYRGPESSIASMMNDDSSWTSL